MSKNSKYVELMEKVNQSLGIICLDNKEPLIYMVPDNENEESQPLLSSSGLPYYMPTYENSKSLISVKETGETVLEKLIFSPVPEDTIQTETQSFITLKERISFNINLAIYELGFLLLCLVEDDKKVKNIGGDLEMFLLDANKGETRGVRNLVDDNTFTKWSGVCTRKKNLETFKPLITIMSVRNGKVDKSTFKRLTSISFPLFEELSNADRSIDNTINGVKLRNKDLVLFHSIFTTIVRKLKLHDYTYMVGSNHEDYPAFISLYSMYIDVMENILALYKRLSSIDTSNSVLSKSKLPINSEELSDMVTACQKDIDLLPTERSLMVAQIVGEDKHQEQRKAEVNVSKSLQEEEKPKVVVRDGTPQQPTYYQPGNVVGPVPTPDTSTGVTDKAAAMFNTMNTGFGPGIPVMTNDALRLQQNPAMSFISATNGGGYTPPSIGASTAMDAMTGAVPVMVDTYGNSFPPASVVSPYGTLGVTQPAPMTPMTPMFNTTAMAMPSVQPAPGVVGMGMNMGMNPMMTSNLGFNVPNNFGTNNPGGTNKRAANNIFR